MSKSPTKRGYKTIYVSEKMHKGLLEVQKRLQREGLKMSLETILRTALLQAFTKGTIRRIASEANISPDLLFDDEKILISPSATQVFIPVHIHRAKKRTSEWGDTLRF